MRILLALSLSLLPCVARAEGFCAGDLTSDATTGLIAYLENLFSENQITNSDLRSMRQSFAIGDIRNPFSNATDLTARIHQRAIQEYLEAQDLKIDRLSRWSTEFLDKQERDSATRADRTDETTSVFVKEKFLTLKPGAVDKMYLTHTIAVMQTPVTQRMWVELMRQNPSHSRSGGDALTMNIDGRAVRLLPDHPVEQLTWFEAAEFANRMSVRDGFAPVYDISDFDNVRVNAPDGDIYRAEGYRLPTAVEMMFLLSGRGATRNGQVYGMDASNFQNFAWLSPNSGDQTQPVATLEAVVVGGQEFYDLIGNVNVWIHDRGKGKFRKERNPVRVPSPDQWVGGIMGAANMMAFSLVKYRYIRSMRLDQSNHHTGLRLVRTLK